MKTSQGLKLGLIISSSILLAGGGIMAGFGVGLTYDVSVPVYKTDGTFSGLDTYQLGMGMFNFDTKHAESHYKNTDYGKQLELVKSWSPEFKKSLVVAAEAGVTLAKANPRTGAERDAHITVAENYLGFINLQNMMPTMQILAIVGLSVAPVALLVLIGACLIKTRSKASTEV